MTWIADDTLSGWVFDVDDPLRPVMISITLNGILFQVHRCAGLIDQANLTTIDPVLRQDWDRNSRTHKILAGAFCYRVPDYVPRRDPVHITVRHHASQMILLDETRQLDADAARALGALLESEPYVRMRAEQIVGGRVLIVAQTSWTGPCGLVGRGGTALSETKYEHVTPPAHTFSFRDHAVLCIARGYLEVGEELETPIDVELEDSREHRRIGDGAAVLPIPARIVREHAGWRMPTPSQINRVMGVERPLDYFLGGYGTYAMIDRILRQCTEKSLLDQRRILDWGCGVGRLAQHLLRWTSAEVLGVDIDRSAVEWCRENLPRGRFATVPLDPPTRIESESFDLIIGISVFTHLSAASQDAWLDELQRILAPGGTLLLTISGFRSLFVHRHATIEFGRMRRAGISDAVVGTLLKDILPPDRSTYYRETHHSHDYIIGHWSRWFDVVAILPGGHFHHQDYVVLRHRSPRPAPTRIMPVEWPAL